MDLWEKLKILRSFGLDKKKDFNFSLIVCFFFSRIGQQQQQHWQLNDAN